MPNGTRKTLGITAAVLVLILLVAAAFTFVQHRGAQNVEPGQNQNKNSSEPEAQPQIMFPPAPPEDDQIFSYMGPITSIDKDKNIVTIATHWGDKQIQITPQTKIVGRDMKLRRVVLSVPVDDIADAIHKEIPFDKKLEVGLSIIAQSVTDQKNKSPFIADSVIVYFLPKS